MQYIDVIKLFGITLLLLAGTAPSAAAPEPVVFSGRILNVEGQPIKGAEVYAYTNNKVKRPADYISNTTGADGFFTMTLPEGTYWFLAILRQSGARFGPLTTGDKHSGEPVSLQITKGHKTEIDFQVMDLREAARQIEKKNKQLFRVSGTIRDQNGIPWSSAYAVADSKATVGRVPRYISGWTDDSGSYTMFLPAGTFLLGAATIFPSDKDYTLPMQVQITQDLNNIDIILSRE